MVLCFLLKFNMKRLPLVVPSGEEPLMVNFQHIKEVASSMMKQSISEVYAHRDPLHHLEQKLCRAQFGGAATKRQGIVFWSVGVNSMQCIA